MARRPFHDQWVRKYGTRTDLAPGGAGSHRSARRPARNSRRGRETEETSVGLVSRVRLSPPNRAAAPWGKCRAATRPSRPPLCGGEITRTGWRKRRPSSAREIHTLMNQLRWRPAGRPVVVIGLGNWNATPDALGRVRCHHLSSRVIFITSAPPDGRRGMRPVAGLAPGVLGITGLETAGNRARAWCDKCSRAVVCVDASGGAEHRAAADDRSKSPMPAFSRVRVWAINASVSTGIRWGCPCWPWACRRWCARTTVVGDGLERLAATAGCRGPDRTGRLPTLGGRRPRLFRRGESPPRRPAARSPAAGRRGASAVGAAGRQAGSGGGRAPAVHG